MKILPILFQGEDLGMEGQANAAREAVGALSDPKHER